MSQRLIRLMIRLAPVDFRRRYGDELLTVHRRRAEDGELGWWFFTREVAGLAWMVLGLRLRAWMNDEEGKGAMNGMLQDLRYALRALRRHPGYTVTAVLVLALGIGANAAIFATANAYFFRPLPFPGEDRLVAIYETNPEFGWTHADAAPANALDWREQVDAFEDLALYSSFVGDATLIREGSPELLGYTNVTGNFFSLLAVPAALGRTFRWDEGWNGAPDVAILSHDAWVSRFGADPAVVGSTVELSGSRVEVVGVMPEGFTFPASGVDLWTPFGWEPSVREATWFRRAHWLKSIARLAEGVTPEEAQAQLQVVVERLSEAYPETNSNMGAGLMPLRDFLIREVRTPLLILMGAVGVLLLLAAVNVANLTLVRAASRSREVALRRALGAGRARVTRLLITESLVLAVMGGAAGLAVGWAGVGLMERLTPLGIDGSTTPALDGRVVLFTVTASLVAGLIFGVLPAVRSVGRRIRGTLAAGGGRGSRGRSGLRGVRALVVAEVALALLLVAGAGLMVRSFVQLRAVDPGFNPQGTLAVSFQVPAARYAERDQVLSFYDRLVDGVEARPGIERAGTVGQLPLAGKSWSSQLQAQGWPPDRVAFEIVHRRADRGYFEALEIPLVRGRFFGPQDQPDGPLVVLANETFARQHFPGEDPIGQKVAYDRAANENPGDHNWYEIVGIVGDQHQVSPGEPVMAELFEYRDQDWNRVNWLVVRTSAGDASDALATVRSVLREIDPLVPIAEARPLQQVWRASLEREQFILTLLGIFGAVALLLATVGVYGVTAQAARVRTREIGIRMALGAEKGDLLTMVLRQSLILVGLGLALGLAGALVTSRMLESLLFQVEPNDPWTLVGVALLLGLSAAVASWLPARRASTVDPVASLRAE